jgi:hypothetical protein
VEVADIIRAAGAAFFDGSKWLTWLQVKVLTAILYCRTAVLGGHVDACSRCGYQTISYNSCLMGSNSLWGVKCRKSMLQRGSTPFRLSIKIWPSGTRAVCREPETCPCEGSAVRRLR